MLDELIVEGTFGAATEVTLRVGAETGERLALVAPTRDGVRLPDDVRVVGADELAAGKRAWIHEIVAGRRWRISAESFFQTRPDGAAALVDVVRELCVDVLDAAPLEAPGGRTRCSTRTAESGSSPAALLADRAGWRGGDGGEQPGRPSPMPV